MKTGSSKLQWCAAGAVTLVTAALLIPWCASNSSWQVREQLKYLSPLSLEINWWLIVVAAVVCAQHFRRSGRLQSFLRSMSGRAWVGLAAVVLLGAVLVTFVAPRVNRIYYDEQIYQNIAQGIACAKGSDSPAVQPWGETAATVWKRVVGPAGMCNEGRNEFGEYSCYRLEYNKEPNGWPFVLSLVYRVFGVSEIAAHLTANALFVLCILGVFAVGVLLFRSVPAGLLSALVLSCTPEVLIWSNTVAVEPSAAVFPVLAVLCLLLYLREKSWPALFLAATVIPFACQFRPESVMICAVLGLLVLLQDPAQLRSPRLYLMAAMVFLLLVPHLAHLYAVRDMGWGSSGPKFALAHVPGNLQVNGLFYFRNIRYPLVFTVLALVGLCLPARSEALSLWRQKLVLAVWFLLFWGIFIFFYAGSYNYGADVRFSLLSAVPLALLAGCGAAQICERLPRWATAAVPVLLLVAFFSFLPRIRAVTQEAWAARADVRYAREMAHLLPENSVVLTHNPNMFLLWGHNAAQASLATEQSGYFRGFFHRYPGGVYFHYNFWCNVSDPLQNSFCTNLLQRFECTEIFSGQERDYRYALYRVERKSR